MLIVGVSLTQSPVAPVAAAAAAAAPTDTTSGLLAKAPVTVTAGNRNEIHVLIVKLSITYICSVYTIFTCAPFPMKIPKNHGL